MSEAELENRLAAVERQVSGLTKIAGRKTITSLQGEEFLNAVEQARKRLFGYHRDGMASAGGKIVG